MAVELIKDLLKLDQTVGEGTSQALVEGDILVPDVKPDISRILSVDGRVNITGKQALQDKIVVDGAVSFKILYVSDGADYPIYSMDANAGFSQSIDIPTTSPEMDVDVAAQIEHIDYSIMNERKISVKIVVNLMGKSMSTCRMEILKDIMGIEDAQVLKKKMAYHDHIGTHKAEAMVRETFELEESMPNIEEIVKCSALAVEKETQVTDGKVIVSGVVKTNTLYIADDGRNTLIVLKHEIPFTQFVEMMGVMKDMPCQVSLKTGEVFTEVKENMDGDKRIFDVETGVNVEVTVSDMEEKELILDAYSPSKALKIEKQKVDFSKTVGANSSNMVVKETLELPKAQPEIFKICNVNVTPVITETSLVEDKCIIEGIIESSVLYLSQTDNQSIYSFTQETPFRHFVEVEGAKENMGSQVAVHINDVDYSLVNPEQLELKVNVGAFCMVSQHMEIDVVVDLHETEEKVDMSKKPSITIYYVQPGDTLWKIAKRYHTTVRDLVEANDIQNPEMIMPGDQIIIQKKYEYTF